MSNDEWDFGDLESNKLNNETTVSETNNAIDDIMKGKYSFSETESRDIETELASLQLDSFDSVSAFKKQDGLAADTKEFDEISALVDAADLADDLYDVEETAEAKALKNKYKENIASLEKQIDNMGKAASKLSGIGSGSSSSSSLAAAAAVNDNAAAAGGIASALSNIDSMLNPPAATKPIAQIQQKFTGLDVSEEKIGRLKESARKQLKSITAYLKQVVETVKTATSIGACLTASSITTDLRQEFHLLDELVCQKTGDLTIVLKGGLPKLEIGEVSAYRASLQNLVLEKAKIIASVDRLLQTLPNSDPAPIIRCCRLINTVKTKINKDS